MNELRKVEGFPRYLAGDDGVVWRRIGRSWKPAELQKPSPAGFASVRLRTGGRRVTALVPSVIATAFLGERPPGYIVAHRNGDIADNRPSNLFYKRKGASGQKSTA